MPTRADTRPNLFARSLFHALPRRYDTLAWLLSFGQDRRWRRAVVDEIARADPKTILDVACGPAGITLAIMRATNARVVGVDLTEPMLRQGLGNVRAAKADDRVKLALARAEELPFPDAAFDALSFSYLMRYVADPEAAIVELARCVKPGGTIASLEFHVPPWAPARATWHLYTRILLPSLGFLLGGLPWLRVGRFLGPSISGYVKRYPENQQKALWKAAGLENITSRRMSFGGGLIIFATKAQAQGKDGRRVSSEPGTAPHDSLDESHVKPAFYASGRGDGKARDWLSLSHPPYTAWHLSYVAIGAALARPLDLGRLGWSLLAFFLGLGIGAHALDELNGRPLRTGIARWQLLSAAVASIAAACAIGWVIGGVRLLPFIVVGAVLAFGYNLEWFGGALHNAVGFAFAWGAFPLLTGFYAQHWNISAAAVIAAGAAFALTLAQRALSTPARWLRRRVTHAHLVATTANGESARLAASEILKPLEAALRALSWAMVALAISLIVAARG